LGEIFLLECLQENFDMKTISLKSAALLGALLAVFPLLSQAQVSANYTLTQGGFTGGGGRSSSGNYVVNGELPPMPGSSVTSANYAGSAGFWNAGVIAPYANLSSVNFTFVAQSIGTTSAGQVLTITNSGSAPLVISGLSISTGFVQGGSCIGTLAAGASCTATITFNPTAAGAVSGTLTLASNAANNPGSIALAGTGVAAATSSITLSSTSLSFSGTAANAISAAQPLTITNSGNAPLTISGITASAPFTQTNACTSIAAGSDCTISVTFNPTTVGSASGTLTITSNAVSSPNLITLNGNAFLALAAGWNLIGNGSDATVNVADILADAATVTSVWKWIPSTSKWAFYAPSMGAALESYTTSKGYDVLTTVKAGEGFWVNAKSAIVVQMPAGIPLATTYFQDNTIDPTQNKLVHGWNLIATGDNKSPSDFNKGLSLTPPAIGIIPSNLTTLWAWDNTKSYWYFYAPALEANSTLASYISSKNYLEFTDKKLGHGVGFWVNKP
jgi:hypothetical protein